MLVIPRALREENHRTPITEGDVLLRARCEIARYWSVSVLAATGRSFGWICRSCWEAWLRPAVAQVLRPVSSLLRAACGGRVGMMMGAGFALSL